MTSNSLAIEHDSHVPGVRERPVTPTKLIQMLQILDQINSERSIIAIEACGLQASAITFEITESRLMEHISVTLEILSHLSLSRFNLSIDDFGTGYSSMEQLQRIPFSIKISPA